MFSCWWFEEPRLPHWVPLSAGSPPMSPVTLATSVGVRHPPCPSLLPPPPALPSLGTTPIRALSFSSFPAPGVPWGLQWLGYLRRPISGFSPNRLISRQEVGSGGGRIPRGFSSC